MENSTYMSFEDNDLRELFDNSIKDFMEVYIQPYKTIFLDEFQYSRHGGRNLKYVHDTLREKGKVNKIIVSGSSSIDLIIHAVKYLVGRIFVFNLYPLSFSEFMRYKNRHLYTVMEEKTPEKWNEILQQFSEMIKPFFLDFINFGGFPRVALCESSEEKIMVLKNIYQTYLLRDVRDLIDISDDYKMQALVKALSLQIGNLLSYQELSTIAGVSFETLKKYLNFLEKTYIIQRITPFFKNKRTELVKNPKQYFIDTGLRNIVINDFRRIDIRVDKGSLLENYHFSEYFKNGIVPRFWRIKSGAEVDFVLEDYQEAIP